MTTFALNPSHEGVVDDAGEIAKRIPRLARIEVVHVDETILNTIRHHVFTVGVVSKIRLER